MLAKQEMEEIVLYFQENGKSFKERLIEQNIPAEKFYVAGSIEIFLKVIIFNCSLLMQTKSQNSLEHLHL